MKDLINFMRRSLHSSTLTSLIFNIKHYFISENFQSLKRIFNSHLTIKKINNNNMYNLLIWVLLLSPKSQKKSVAFIATE